MIWLLGDAAPFTAYGKALAGCREKAYLQVHFGADYHTGKYGWTQDLEQIKRSIAWQLDALRTDYIDFGFIHCVDELSDLEKAVSGGVLDYIQALKKQEWFGTSVFPRTRLRWYRRQSTFIFSICSCSASILDTITVTESTPMGKWTSAKPFTAAVKRRVWGFQ